MAFATAAGWRIENGEKDISAKRAHPVHILPNQCVFFIFVPNLLKYLSMNNLHIKLSFPGQAQSSLVKPN